MTRRPRTLLLLMASFTTSCASASRNPALDSYPAGVEGRTLVTYYDVHGRTYAELGADMRRRGPKILGGSYVGETRSPMSWTWRTESVAGGSCSLRDVRVNVNAEILLPRWTPPADADSSLVVEWKRFITALETHEAGHKDISARAGREIKDQLRGLMGLCADVGARANDIARRILDDANRAQKDYDAATRHGLTQGTTFGPAPSSGATPTLAGRARADSAAERVVRLVVTPTTLELKRGDSLTSVQLFGRLDLRGITTEGDTVRDFARTFLLEQNDILVRSGPAFVAREPGDATVWVFVGTRPRTDRDPGRTVRVPIHIR